MKNIKFPEAIQKNVAIISITYNNVIELTTNGLCQLQCGDLEKQVSKQTV